MLPVGGAPATDVFPRRRRQRPDRVHRRGDSGGNAARLGGGKSESRAPLRRRPRHPRRARSGRDQVPQRLMPVTWTQARAAPPTLLPAAAGAIVIAVALPIFLLAGWPPSRAAL